MKMNIQKAAPPNFENIEKIIEYMPGNIYWFDRNGLGVGCNKNVLALFNFKSVSEFKGLTFERMGKLAGWSPDATASFKKDTLAVITTGKAKINVEEPAIPDSAGNLTYYLTTRVPFYDSNGMIAGMVGVSIDITERKKMEVALREAKLISEKASHRQSEFIANMSHDIKTPLTGIMGIADILMHRLAKEEDVHFAEEIISAGKQLMTFFDHCLELAKSESSDATLLNEHFNLEKLLQEIVHLFQPAITNKGLKLTVYYDDKLPDNLLGNRASLSRILINLVGNAIKFTEAGSITIHVKLGKKSTDKKIVALFTITDTGIGIAKDKHAYIFERFTRLTQANTGLNPGSGLGLYLVKKYVENMQGEIHLHSEENQGSQFVVAVPLEISLLSPAEYEKNNSFSLENRMTIKKDEPVNLTFSNARFDNIINILLIEDNVIAQTVVRSIMRSLHCHVDVASTGKEAIGLFEIGKYQLVLTDLGLPDISGHDVISRFRQKEKGTKHRTPIIMLTAHITEEVKKECIEAGIDEVCCKPLMTEQAKHILEHYVEMPAMESNYGTSHYCPVN